MRKDHTTRAPGSAARPEEPPPAYRVGQEIIFKFEGNLRARVEGHEAVGGRLWLVVRVPDTFTVPPSLIVGVEPDGEE